MQNEKTNAKATNNKPLSFIRYYLQELTHGHFMDKNDARYSERRERVYTFFKQPFEIEKMMIYGWLLCLDVFLTAFTFLPLRFFYALLRTIFSPIIKLRGGIWLDTALKCDVLKGCIFIMCSYLLSFIDTSVIYHLVRAQTLIKLYIIYNMLEVADRLFSSFGQDILDALFITVTESSKKKREFFWILLHFFLAVIYIFGHATLVLFQATTLNVAFNSHNKVLLTIMMANNFVEIKGTVFKKYDKNNLFQISCADIRERFHNFLLMVVVTLRNMQQYDWNAEHFADILPNMFWVIVSEHMIDWFKHAFVVKFNHIPIGAYNEFRATLAYDVASSRHKNSNSDHSDVVSRRLGFIPLPLAVLIFHVVRISVNFDGQLGIAVVILGYFMMNLLKIVNNIVVVGKAVVYIKQDIKTTATQQLEKTLEKAAAGGGGGAVKQSELSILDPFEQRGNRTIIVPKPLRATATFDSTSVLGGGGGSCSSRRGGGDESDALLRQRTNDNVKKSDAEFLHAMATTPAKERSMRPPSVDGDQMITNDDYIAISSPTLPPSSSNATDKVGETTTSTRAAASRSQFTAATTRTKLDFEKIIEE